MSDLFIPRNPIETAKEFQWRIGLAHPEEAYELAEQALDLIGDVREIYGTKKLLIHSLAAYVINRGLTQTEEFRQAPLGESVIRGSFGGIIYHQQLTEPRIQSLLVDIYDVELLESENKTQTMSSPLVVPVLEVQSVLAAA